MRQRLFHALIFSVILCLCTAFTNTTHSGSDKVKSDYRAAQSFAVHANPRICIAEEDRKAKYELIITNGKYSEAVIIEDKP